VATDIELVESLCAQHLTVKPRVPRARTFCKDNIKTLFSPESSEAANDLFDQIYLTY